MINTQHNRQDNTNKMIAAIAALTLGAGTLGYYLGSSNDKNEANQHLDVTKKVLPSAALTLNKSSFSSVRTETIILEEERKLLYHNLDLQLEYFKIFGRDLAINLSAAECLENIKKALTPKDEFLFNELNNKYQKGLIPELLLVSLNDSLVQNTSQNSNLAVQLVKQVLQLSEQIEKILTHSQLSNSDANHLSPSEKELATLYRIFFDNGFSISDMDILSHFKSTPDTSLIIENRLAGNIHSELQQLSLKAKSYGLTLAAAPQQSSSETSRDFLEKLCFYYTEAISDLVNYENLVGVDSLLKQAGVLSYSYAQAFLKTDNPRKFERVISAIDAAISKERRLKESQGIKFPHSLKDYSPSIHGHFQTSTIEAMKSAMLLMQSE